MPRQTSWILFPLSIKVCGRGFVGIAMPRCPCVFTYEHVSSRGSQTQWQGGTGSFQKGVYLPKGVPVLRQRGLLSRQKYIHAAPSVGRVVVWFPSTHFLVSRREGLEPTSPPPPPFPALRSCVLGEGPPPLVQGWSHDSNRINQSVFSPKGSDRLGISI